MKTSITVESLSGDQLWEMFSAATTWLERNVDSINAINVFPVPDGDTGTNMHLTMRSTMEEAARSQSNAVGEVLATLAHGALMGARGNSGVILSQVIRGLATASEGADTVDPAGLVVCLESGSAQAYRAVTKPVEGTILTVIREVAAATRQALPQAGQDIIGIMDVAVVSAERAVARTPSLLPVLAEAGVVDAGGQGLFVLLDGMARQLKGEPTPAAVAVAAGDQSVQGGWLAGTHQLHEGDESPYGYCTEFLIVGRQLDAELLRARMLELGDSVLVVGDERLIRVHVHTDDPGAALGQGTRAGSLSQVKVDNIQQQADKFLERHDSPTALQTQLPAVVALASGEGLAQVFRDVGAAGIVSGGPTMNPSTRDILDVVEACPSHEVIVLPNDKNIIMAARQTLELTDKRVRVVPTTSIPQGIAALLALTEDSDADASAEAMEEARLSVRTVEVCRAVRGTTVKGITVRQGQAIAIIEDELTLAAESPDEALSSALAGMPLEGTSLITLYYGADTGEEQARAVARELERTYPGHEVEVVYGGQPHYNYIASLE